ncbi:MAG: FAD:protein FMN transferase [Nitrospiraceae bacterium]|nr:FAD:protein FMN transferase [Nitrospiraceae bacterium]
MDTLVTITVVSDSPRKADAAIDAAFAEIRHLEKLISFWDPRSEISALSREAGIRPVKVSPETMDLVEKAIYVSRQTDGAFDCTMGPVIKLWNIPYNKTIPDSADIKKALELVGYKAVKIDPKNSTVFLGRKGMSFDTGGIAKGWANDYAEAVLKSKGIKAGLISIAGDVKGFGRKPDGHGWRVGIENPRPKGKDDAVLASVELLDEDISTSGDYERYIIVNGVRYHHILDPRTGYPARGFESVTLITPEGVWSDGFSKIFVMGPGKGPALARKLGFGIVTVTDDGAIHISGRDLEKRVTVYR